MPRVLPNLQKFFIVSAAVSGIGLLWGFFTIECFETASSIVENQMFYKEEDVQEEEDEQEGEDAQQLLIRLGEQKDLEDEK